MSWTQAAIQNNMDWYQEQCSAHGILDHRRHTLWYTLEKMPPLHSNLICCESTLPQDIVQGLDERLGYHWGLKAAHGDIDLRNQGFDLLFNAQWFVRTPTSPTDDDGDNVEWIESDRAFEQWVADWMKHHPVTPCLRLTIGREPILQYCALNTAA